LPASKRVASKQVTAVTRRNENAGHSATSPFDISEMNRRIVLLCHQLLADRINSTERVYRWDSTRASEQRVTLNRLKRLSLARMKSPASILYFIVIRGEFKSCWWTHRRLSCQAAAWDPRLRTAISPTSSFLHM